MAMRMVVSVAFADMLVAFMLMAVLASLSSLRRLPGFSRRLLVVRLVL
jgi:hypothetical protein